MIKDLIPATCSLNKFIYKVMAYIVLIGERCLGLYIWPEAADQTKDKEDLMRKVQTMEAHYQQKTNGNHFIAFFAFSKEVSQMNQLTSYNMTYIMQI